MAWGDQNILQANKWRILSIDTLKQRMSEVALFKGKNNSSPAKLISVKQTVLRVSFCLFVSFQSLKTYPR